jgi:hypothetical protein
MKSLPILGLVCALGMPVFASAQSYKLERAFPRLTFDRAVFLTDVPGDEEHLHVVLQAGRIQRFPRTTDPDPTEVQTILDISGNVLFRANEEQGLLGLAFAPDFANSREFYVHYSFGNNDSASVPGPSRVSRFRLQQNSVLADPATEQVILSFTQPFRNHNGGWIGFGPQDGYLYIASGDGGSGNDPDNNGQNLSTLLGKILRIDAVGGRGTPSYLIPPTNPFLSNGNARPEIYAYGLRNPFRCSFDSERGFLLAGDVGQSAFEEVNHITSGSNYGWRNREGFQCRPGESSCTPGGVTFTEPLEVYGRDVGQSITGGCVYYGTRNPMLVGRYLFGDYVSGRIWVLPEYNGGGAPLSRGQLIDATINISSFGQTTDGEVFVVGYASPAGTLHRLAVRPVDQVAGLTTTGVVTDLNEDGVNDAADLVQAVIR